MQTTERALVAAAREGDRLALERVLSSFMDQIYRFGVRMCRNPQDAEDITQDTLLAATRSFENFRAASSVRTWLYAIARRACLRKRRRKKDEPARLLSLGEEVSPAELKDEANRMADEAVAEGEVASLVQAALARLRASEREVLLLRDMEGLSAPEVAQVLGIKLDAVKSRLHRARLNMRAALVDLQGAVKPFGERRPSCPDVLQMLSHHLEGDIDAEACAKMAHHLEACPDCRADCDSLKETLALCRDHHRARVPADIQERVRGALRAALTRARWR